MKTIKIIDLLNMISKGEEVPKRIKYNNKIYIAKGNAIENFVDYCNDEDEWCFNHYVRYENLNDEVEILEEPKKIPEKIKSYYDVGLEENCIYEEGNKKNNVILGELNSWKLIIDKINEILDYLESKGE